MASKASKTSRRKSTGNGKGGAKSSAGAANGAGSGSEQGQADQTPASDAAPTDDDQDRILSDDELRKVKTGLAKRELKRFRNPLLQRRAEIVGAVESLESGARSNDEPISFEHMADTGTARILRSWRSATEQPAAGGEACEASVEPQQRLGPVGITL